MKDGFSHGDEGLPPEMPRGDEVSEDLTEVGQPVKGRFGFSKVLGRWWWLGVLLVVVVTVVVSMLPGWLKVRGPLYESVALIEVRPIPDVEVSVARTTHSSTGYHSTFIQTQFEVIKSRETLKLALRDQGLLARLGGDEAGAIERMRESIKNRPKPGTDLIEIAYRDEDAQLAFDVCEAIYNAYKERRVELEMGRRKEDLMAIEIELKNKKRRVEELRKKLMDVARKTGANWRGDNNGDLVSSDPGLRNLIDRAVVDVDKEIEMLKIQIEKMKDVRDEDLPVLAAELSDVGFRQAYNKYEKAQAELHIARASGLSEKHPDIVMRKTQIEELRKGLVKRALNVRESLIHRLKIVEQRARKSRDLVHREHDNGTQRTRGFQEFMLARKNYQVGQEISDQMQIKYDVEKTKLAIPAKNVILHQRPEVSGRTVTRGREFVSVLGTVASLPFSLVGGIVLMYLAEVVFPRRV